MYSYKDIKSMHLEITSKCQARCPMCPRRLCGGPLDPYITLDEITLEQFKSWFPVDFLNQLIHINMCGNLGDPIIARDTLEICKYIKEINPNTGLYMHTNGSARSISWWEELATTGIQVNFGIDGLRDTHHLYRIATDWDLIIRNAKAFIAAGGIARWDMLIFAHNAHQVEMCREMSKELGFKDFFAKNTSRFKDKELRVIDDNGRTTHVLYATEKSELMIPKIKKAQEETLATINCKAKKHSQIYVSATGIVSPCCWLDVEWMPPVSYSRIDYLDKINVFHNLKKETLKEIFDSGYFESISSCWKTTGLRECTKQCGSFDKFNEQFS